MILLSTTIFAQVFEGETGIISDKISSDIIPCFFKIPVTLPTNIDASFGLEKVSFHIKHKRPTDLKIDLLSPDGTSVWLSNRNGDKNTYGYLNTSIVQNGFNGPIHEESVYYFEGEFGSEGRLDFINNGQNPNGIWLLIVTDLQEGTLGKLESVSLTFGNNPAKIDQSACTEENVLACYSSYPEQSMLPDLMVSKSLTSDNITYYNADHKQYPNQLRFAAAMANIGEGPLHIVTTNNWYCGGETVDKDSLCPDQSYPTNNVQQIIYRIGENQTIEYDTLKAGVMYFDDNPGHNHYHVKNWANFTLLKKRWWSKSPKFWQVVASSEKISYCLFDNKICDELNEYCKQNGLVYSQKNLQNYGLGTFNSCNSKVQGISVGGIDYYGINYEGQSIAIPPDISKGKYQLLIEVDPSNEYLESDETNNSIIIQFEIK